MHYRAVNNSGLTFDSNNHLMRFGSGPWVPTMVKGSDPEEPVLVSPRSPDMFGDLVVFASGEDPDQPNSYGTWMTRPGEQLTRLTGVTWRSLYPGRFAPDGTYYLSAKGNRTLYYKWKNGVLAGPFNGVTGGEGISDFQPDGNGGWIPVWQNRAHPITVDGYKLPIWFRTPNWLYGMNSPTDRSVAKHLTSGQWYEITKSTSQIAPCVKEQTNGSLTVAWNGNAESYLNSNDTGANAWVLLNQPPVPEPEPPPTGEVAPQIKYPRPIFFAPYDSYAKPKYGNTARPIGNAAFPWEDSLNDIGSLPIIGYSGEDYIGKTLYYYIHAGGTDPWKSALEQWEFLKDKPERPVILYFDGRKWPEKLPEWVPLKRTFLGVQAYPEPGETQEAFNAAMKVLFDRVTLFKLPIVLTPCFYTMSGALTLEEVRRNMPLYDQLVMDYKVVGIMPFSDMRTGTGMSSYPVLYDDAQRMMNAIPARPNRYTYWTPSDPATAKKALKDQVRYEISGFSAEQADVLCALIEEHL